MSDFFDEKGFFDGKSGLVRFCCQSKKEGASLR